MLTLVLPPVCVQDEAAAAGHGYAAGAPPPADVAAKEGGDDSDGDSDVVSPHISTRAVHVRPQSAHCPPCSHATASPQMCALFMLWQLQSLRYTYAHRQSLCASP